MDSLLMRSRLNLPVTTGIPSLNHTPETVSKNQNDLKLSFREILENTAKANDLSFSKHAADRVVQRDIEISEESLERLNEGVQIAKEKGLEDALILMDGSAFIVSAKNSKVITALDSRELKGKVFTNINGTVIV